MKRSRIFSICLLMTILIVPFMGMSTMVTAQNKPSYVGVNEGQVIIWKTEFDDGPLEDYIEDKYGESYPENQKDLRLEEIWDPLEYDDDVVAWRVTITDIRKEDDLDYDGEHFDEDDVNYVTIVISIYETEDQGDPNAWEALDRIEKFKLYEPEEKVYADFVYEGFTDEGMGLYAKDVAGDRKVEGNSDSEWPMFFVPKRLDWDEIVEETDDKAEAENVEDERTISEQKEDFFFQRKEVGLDTNLEDRFNIEEDFDSIIKFTDDGIMYYYEWSYDGDTIAKFELDTFGGLYLIENWWWIALIAAGVVVLVIVIIIIIKVKRK